MAVGRGARLCVVVLAFTLGLSEGLVWQSDDFLHVTGCVGDFVLLPWAFSLQPGETMDTIFWTQAQETIASLYQENFVPKGDKSDRVTHSLRLNAAVNISRLQLSDTGYYGVKVTVATKDDLGNQLLQTFNASALLTVVDAPKLLGEALTAQEVTPDTCALKRQVTLKCGNFSSRGFPPVDVVWTDPAGQQLPSTRFQDGHFDLDLYRRPLPGNYTCRVTCQSPVMRCLAPDSPLLGSAHVHVQSAREDGCGDASAAVVLGEGSPGFAVDGSDPVDLDSVVHNLTQLHQYLQDLDEDQKAQEQRAEEREERREVQAQDVTTQVEELRKLVVTSIQKSDEAQAQVLLGLVASLQTSVAELQQNLSALQLQVNQEPLPAPPVAGSEDLNQEAVSRLDRMLDDMDVRYSREMQSLRTQLEDRDQANTNANLSQAQSSLESRHDSLANAVQQVQEAHQGHADSLAEVWRDLSSLQDLSDQTTGGLQQQLTSLTSQLQDLSRLSPQLGCGQCNVTQAMVEQLEHRLDKLQDTVDAAWGRGQRAPVLATDPLVSKAEETTALTSPPDDSLDTVYHTFVITSQGDVVIGDERQSHVIIAPNASSSDLITVPLKHGTHVRQLCEIQGDVVAATVDDFYLLVLDVQAPDPDDMGVWIRTPAKYSGVAARSRQTVYVGVSPTDADDGKARIDVIALQDVNAVLIKTLLNQTSTPELQDPRSLTVHEDRLYISDWETGRIIVLDLESLAVVSNPGPGPGPQNPNFFQPRQTAFDANGNMFVATGGTVCGTGKHRYSTGFCVLVESKEGSWKKLLYRGPNIYPYGVALTSTGLAVTWVSWVTPPARSMVQWYDLVEG